MLWALSIGLGGFALLGAATPGAAQALPGGSSVADCGAIQDAAARLRCFEAANSPQAQQEAPVISGWHLVRTPNPETGHEVVSIMRTADTSQSDLGLAGLMLRCGDAGTEVLFAVIEPFPPRAQPQVTLRAGSTNIKLTASIVAPGALVLLPPEASALAEGAWQTATKLDVLITDKQDSIRGVIPLTGLKAAVALLQASCRGQ